MSTAGWYPDPGGKPERYRYWDGESWSEVLTDDPADPAPGAGTDRRPRGIDSHPGRSILVALLVLVVVVVSAVLIVRRTADASSVVDPPAASTPSRTAGGPATPGSSSSRSPSATAPSADPSRHGDGSVDCPAGRPDELALHPQDGRIHGGRLSMNPIDGYAPAEPEYMLSWMWDTEGISQATEPGWQSIFAVGEVKRADDFAGLRAAARSSLSCAKRTGWYLHPTGAKTIRDESIMIDDHQAWIVTAEIHDDGAGVSVEGDQLTFVAVDDGRDDAYSVWCGMVPLGDQTRLALNQRVLSGLRVRG